MAHRLFHGYFQLPDILEMSFITNLPLFKCFIISPLLHTLLWLINLNGKPYIGASTIITVA